jgi:hypothetical protein
MESKKVIRLYDWILNGEENQQKILKMSFVEREVVLEQNFNYVFVGLRRAGKTLNIVFI